MATSLRQHGDARSRAPGRRLALVLNEKAGAALARGGLGEGAEALVREAGFEPVAVPPGTLPERIAAAVASGADIVAVAGGDGTVACAAEALAGSELALGILPCGTMDLMARDLALPVGDPAAALAVVASGTPRAVDVGMLGERPFLCAAMLGTPARLARHREQGREHGNGPLAWWRFARAALRAARREHRLRLEAEIDGRRLRLRTVALTIVVNALDDTSGRTFGRRTLDGGRFAIYVVRGGLLGMVPTLLRGRVAKSRRVAVLRGREITLHARAGALRVLLDGEEHLIAPPLRFTLRPRALKVIAPG